MQNYKVVTSHAGIIKSWRHGGTDILYPAFTTTSGKERGGCFPAIPVFGAVPNTPAWQRASLDKHGLIRLVNESYRVVSDHEPNDRYRTFSMSFPARESYPWSFAVNNRLVVSRSGLSLDYWTTVKREDACRTKPPMPLSFGLHPYFATSGRSWRILREGKVLVDSSQNVTTSLQFDLKRGQEILLQTIQGIVRLMPNKYDQIGIWSDDPSKYICIEPTLGRREEILLAPGKAQSAVCTMTFLPSQ